MEFWRRKGRVKKKDKGVRKVVLEGARGRVGEKNIKRMDVGTKIGLKRVMEGWREKVKKVGEREEGKEGLKGGRN